MKNKSVTYKNFWKTTNVAFRGKFIALSKLIKTRKILHKWINPYTKQ